jgi:NAD(P)-dependent dehydrogenase (short-subunit alcohol dehydrogenase family)
MMIADKTVLVTGANRGIGIRMKRRALAFVVLCLAVALVSSAAAATSGGTGQQQPLGGQLSWRPAPA